MTIEAPIRNGDTIVYRVMRWPKRLTKISSFSSLLYEARWGTAAAAINNLLPISDGLKTYWSKALFTSGKRVEEDASGKGCDADTVDNAIRIQTRQ